ncbi:hypothetical protein QVD17_27941 [Tagetes erecta]|uniref:Uncharacterized protein n=1 Tax=Tagetes erecta TaxID=13708 RepID=A0AAD8K9I1_TARER|nr:hypothetical protein QVD17_27941 [Tagetes erecta]
MNHYVLPQLCTFVVDPFCFIGVNITFHPWVYYLFDPLNSILAYCTNRIDTLFEKSLCTFADVYKFCHK